jgi:hypothetical protein
MGKLMKAEFIRYDQHRLYRQITTLKAENEKMKKALSEILEIHGWRLANLTSNYCDKTMDICKKALKGEK